MHSASSEPEWPPPSLELGAYVLEAPLGRGAMGAVYRGRGPDGAPVAVKVLPRRLLTDETLERFNREAEVRVEHPNVVRLFDSGRADDGSPYLVMELLVGGTLEQRIKGQPAPSPAEIVEIARQICRGLEAVHDAGIVHRDLKPANVFCTRDGSVKVLDFGIARVTTRDTRVTERGVILGTPLYLAPEQARGGHRIDARADLWALGVILYEALTGEAPFDRATPVETLVAVLMDEVPRLQSRVAGLPEELYGIVDKLLSRRPELRHPSAAALGADLERVAVADVATTATQRLPIQTGEQRVVAICFAVDVLDAGALGAAVQAQGGVFSALLGGRAIGVFGGERWEGDEPERAARVALDVRHLVGQVAVSVGRARTSGGTVTGDAVQRAEAATRGFLDGVGLDGETAGLLPAIFETRPAAGGLLELVGEQGRPGMHLAGPPTVGRRRELSQLRDAVEAVEEEGRPWAVLVTGPPGAGKTQLAREMRKLVHDLEDVRVLEAFGQPIARDEAWSLFVALLGAASERRPRVAGQWGDHLDPVLEERRARLEALAREAILDPVRARECALFLAELLGLPNPASPMLDEARRTPQLMAERLRLALSELFDGFVAQGPVALLLEDLHWADGASLDLIEELLARHADRPLLVFATARPQLLELRPTLLASQDTTRLRLRGLGAKHVAALAEHVAGRGLSAELVDAIADRTAGNPLFVVQVVAQLRDLGQLDAPATDLPLPLTVEAAVQSRLDQLADDERRLCRCASIWERAFRPAEVEALGADHPAPVLGRLVQSELLAVQTGPDAGRYAFRSRLIQRVAYRAIEPSMRARLHLDAARYLSASDRHEPEEVARHFEAAGSAPEAAAWLVTATRDAAARGDADTVIRCADHALRLGAAADARFDLHVLRADAFRFVGRRADQGAALDEALEHATTALERARAQVERVTWLVAMGRLDDALVASEVAVAEAEVGGDPGLVAEALARQSSTLLFAGRLDDAAAILDRATGAEAPTSGSTRAFIEAQRGRLAAMRGDVGRAREAFASAARLFRDVGDLRRAAANEQNLADSFNRVGAYTEAITALQEALSMADRAGNRVIQGYALLNLGHAELGAGFPERALASLAEAEKRASTNNEARLLPAVAVYRAEALLTAGRFAEAKAEAERGRELAARTGQRAFAILAQTLRARVALATDQAPLAVTLATEAMAERDELGGVEEGEAELFLVLGRALEATGEGDGARAVLARGRAHLQQVGAHIADEALRERFLTQVVAHRELLATR
ncbi:MAG: protein kinase [Sandaracinaceae bacterium]|nr:protein kinase [Sandaracinaceae bacterium]